MPSFLNSALRRAVEQATGANSLMCWTCSTCDSECPVGIATNRLRPQRIVHYANLGLLDELISLPEIWYCLTCRRCNQVCPNLVKPETVVQYARAEAIRRGVVSYQAAREYYELFRRFQRVRWHLVDSCLEGDIKPITEAMWDRWLNSPIGESQAAIVSPSLIKTGKPFRQAAQIADVSACFTCGECSSACPVSGERGVFDPRFIFRMVNFGLAEDLLRSPSIWLCVQCGRCTEACSQLVDGCRMMDSLRELAVHERRVDADFALRVRDAQKQILVRWIDGIDKLLGLRADQVNPAACRLFVTECV
jgi:heterodisulfide reductase subunit C